MLICQCFEFGNEVEPSLIESAVIEADGALVALIEGVAEDAVEGGEPGTSADEEERLIDGPSRVEAVAGGALDCEESAGLRDGGEPGAHLPIGDEADMEFESSLCGLLCSLLCSLLWGEAGDGIAAAEAVGTEEREILAGAVVERLGGFEEDAKDGVAQAAGLDEACGKAETVAGGFYFEVFDWNTHTGQKAALFDEGGLEACLCGRWDRAGAGTEQTALADTSTAGIRDRNAVTEEAVEDGFLQE